MYSLFAQLVSLLPSASVAGAADVNGVAQNLMERAEASAGRNPHDAQQLRNAAYAYLSVVR